MGRNDSLHRTKPPCSLDAQQDHPEGHRELQNHARAEGISADIEDKIIMTQDTTTYYVWIGGSCDQTKLIHIITFLNIFCIFADILR